MNFIWLPNLGCSNPIKIAINEEGYILLYKFNYLEKTGSVKAHIKLEMKEEREEKGKSIAVCDKSKYILAHLTSEDKYLSSRMVILTCNGCSLVKKASIDLSNLKMETNYGLECLGYRGGNILWVGVTKLGEKVYTYRYQVNDNILKELKQKRVSLDVGQNSKILRLRDQLFFTGSSGRVSLSFPVSIS